MCGILGESSSSWGESLFNGDLLCFVCLSRVFGFGFMDNDAEVGCGKGCVASLCMRVCLLALLSVLACPVQQGAFACLVWARNACTAFRSPCAPPAVLSPAQPSGPYIFRPQGRAQLCPDAPLVEAIPGNQLPSQNANFQWDEAWEDAEEGEEEGGTGTVWRPSRPFTPSASYPPIPKLRVFVGPLVVEVHRHDVEWGGQVKASRMIHDTHVYV